MDTRLLNILELKYLLVDEKFVFQLAVMKDDVIIVVFDIFSRMACRVSSCKDLAIERSNKAQRLRLCLLNLFGLVWVVPPNVESFFSIRLQGYGLWKHAISLWKGVLVQGYGAFGVLVVRESSITGLLFIWSCGIG